MSFGSTPYTTMPNACARCAICVPMPPIPMISAVRPFNSIGRFSGVWNSLSGHSSRDMRGINSRRLRVSESSSANAWSAISGPWMILQLVSVTSLRISSGKRMLSTPALPTCTHLSFLPIRISSGVGLPMNPSASAISRRTSASPETLTTLARGAAACNSFTSVPEAPVTTTLF